MNERSFSIEEVSEAAPVAKLPPLRAAEGGFGAGRSADYLEGFLAKPAETEATDSADSAGEGSDLQAEIVAALRQIFDPEIPVNIYDLGLIYNVEITSGHAIVTMTLTTPNCPVAETMPGEVEMRVMSVPGVASAEVNLVWEPAWDPGKMSDEAKLEMGML
jgi:FeS assembly SUF system protein